VTRDDVVAVFNSAMKDIPDARVSFSASREGRFHDYLDLRVDLGTPEIPLFWTQTFSPANITDTTVVELAGARLHVRILEYLKQKGRPDYEQTISTR
jgi:hypothetical protein